MTLFAIQIGKFYIQYERGFGYDGERRNGWTVNWDGHVCDQLAPDPITAIRRSSKRIRDIRRFRRSLLA